MASPLLFIVLSFLYPTLYLLEVNSYIYTTHQIIATLVFVLLVAAITTLTAGIFVRYIVILTLFIINKCGYKPDIIGVSSKLFRAILCGTGTIILLVLLHTSIRGLIPSLRTSLMGTLYLLISFGISFIFYKNKLIRINFIFGVLIVFNGALLVFYSLIDNTNPIGTTVNVQNLVFKQKPNVYLVVLESYASMDVRKEIYGINNEPLLLELNEDKYDLYKTYSNYGSSLPSISSVFLMDHHYYRSLRGFDDGGEYRKIIGGVIDNPVLKIFLNNGYQIDYSKFNSSLYHPSATICSMKPQSLLQPLELFGGFFVFTDAIIHRPIRTTKFFQTLFFLPEQLLGSLLKTSDRATQSSSTRPVFSLIYAGAGHSPSSLMEYPPEISNMPDADKLPLWKLNRIDNYWVTKYRDLVAKSDVALIKFIADLNVKDPKAIVILLGDHGTYFNRDRWCGEKEDPNKNILKNDMKPIDVTRDLFEVFMAIKWPMGLDKPNEYFSYVNLFRYVFAALSKDSTILKTQVSNDSFMPIVNRNKLSSNFDVYRTVKNGIPLDRWEPFVVAH